MLKFWIDRYPDIKLDYQYVSNKINLSNIDSYDRNYKTIRRNEEKSSSKKQPTPSCMLFHKNKEDFHEYCVFQEKNFDVHLMPYASL